MRPVSTQFLQTVRGSHIIAARAELLFPGSLLPVEVPVEAGRIRVDRTAQNRRTGSITIPMTAGDELRTLTLGGYAIVYRGVRYANGTVELVTLGRLRVESVNWGTLETSATLELADRMSQVRDEPFTAPYSANGRRAWEAAHEIVHQVFGDTIQYHAPYQPTDVILDATYTGNRADALTALEQSAGAETYFDADGDFVFARKPGDPSVSVWDVDTGAQGVLVDARENLDRTGIYNGVLVEGQANAETPPITALAVHDDPGSPIRWNGPFGKVALLVQSSTVQTVEQAQATAQSMLALRLKQTRSLDLTAAPNPALEAGDTIRVVFPDGRDELHLVDAVEIDLGTAAQAIVTRINETPAYAPTLFAGAQAWTQLA